MTMMTNQYLDDPAIYEITILGEIDSDWSNWFGGVRIQHQPKGNLKVSVLSGIIEDQSALHGILKKISDLNLIIISIIRKN